MALNPIGCRPVGRCKDHVNGDGARGKIFRGHVHALSNAC